MVNKHSVQGYEMFNEYVKRFTAQDLVHIYFGGSKLPSGISWCDDCVRAAPVIEKALLKASPKSHFVYVDVGDRATWKDMNCPFRKDARLKLMVLPTVVRWNGHQRLTGDQCEKEELLEMLFTDDD